MSFFQLAVPAVALLSGAYAQSACSTSGTLTVTNTADAQASLGACSTYSGSIAIATDATDMSIPVTRITENLVAVENGQLINLAAPSLRQVDGTMSIQSQANIATLDFPMLTTVNIFSLIATGQNLLTTGFTTGLTQVANLTVQDTFLQDFSGINLATAVGVNVANNALLKDLTMQIRNVTGQLIVRGNSKGLSLSLPNLSSAGSVLVNDCSDVSMPSLANVTTVVAFTENGFSELLLPNLTQVGPGSGGFVVQNSPSLTNVSVPLLAKVQGGVDYVNNSMLTGTISLPSLRLVGSGAFQGAFSAVMMPELDRMQGTLTLKSTKDITKTCQTFSNGGNVAGRVRCASASTASASASSSSTAGNAAAQFGASPETMFGVFGLLAGLFGLLM